jgi:tRNA G26 N,N-dimethylase Trm1
MWSGPIHDTKFVTKVLEHLEANQDKYGTATRMKGMLTVAKEVCIVSKKYTIHSASAYLGTPHTVLFHTCQDGELFPLYYPTT